MADDIDPRTRAVQLIGAMLDDGGDPRAVEVVTLIARELFAAADNFDRLIFMAERQAEALERIHARLGFGFAVERLAEAVERIADLAPRIEPHCPQCGAAMLRVAAPTRAQTSTGEAHATETG
jgi:precorrin-2 methylase